MKGIVADALNQLVVKNFGADAWPALLAKAGLPQDSRFGTNDDLSFDQILSMFGAACELGGMTFDQACDAYGAFWVQSYIPARYPAFYQGVTSTRAFLLKLDSIHQAMAAKMENAYPPRHSYRWEDERTLVMGYQSSYAGLMRLFIGALHGAAGHYGETIETEQVAPNKVRITFP